MIVNDSPLIQSIRELPPQLVTRGGIKKGKLVLEGAREGRGNMVHEFALTPQIEYLLKQEGEAYKDGELIIMPTGIEEVLIAFHPAMMMVTKGECENVMRLGYSLLFDKMDIHLVESTGLGRARVVTPMELSAISKDTIASHLTYQLYHKEEKTSIGEGL